MDDPNTIPVRWAETLSEIRVGIARMEEKQLAQLTAAEVGQKAAEVRHQSVMSAIATFVPRSEIEKDNRALGARIDELERRLATVEKRIWGAVAAILTTAFGAVASLFGVVVKPG